MLGVLCARPKPWLLASLFSFHAHGSTSAAHHRLAASPIRSVLVAEGDDQRRLHHSTSCRFGGGAEREGGAASIWHAILPARGRKSISSSKAAVFHRHNCELTKKGGEGSWNAAWDARPARWLHNADSAWLLFGVCPCLAAPPLFDLSEVNSDATAEDQVDILSSDSSLHSPPPNYRVTGMDDRWWRHAYRMLSQRPVRVFTGCLHESGRVEIRIRMVAGSQILLSNSSVITTRQNARLNLTLCVSAEFLRITIMDLRSCASLTPLSLRGDVLSFVSRAPDHTGVPADGRCLFRAIAHVDCLRNGGEAPDENRQRELADELRAKVVNELLQRRKEAEWFIEGDFDAYVKRIEKPYVWGGEPELLMASHVLQSSGSLINISNYGEKYQKEEDGDTPINVLFHGYGHYDILETNTLDE
nr:OTU domain-containing protein [Ipomoea batatas]